MKLSISIQANSTKTTQITVPSENSIVVNGEDTDLSAIPNNGTADGVSTIIGQVSKDGAGVNTLTVLMQYVPSSTKWNGQCRCEHPHSADAVRPIKYQVERSGLTGTRHNRFHLAGC